MATTISLQPIVLGNLSAIAPPSVRATATASVAETETSSSIVSLSVQGRFLAATATTGTSPQTTASLASTVISAVPQASAANADTLLAGQSATAAGIALQKLVDDPAQRAIANNLFNPVYSALLAAAHQANFITMQAVNRANAIPADIPAPVLPIDRVEGISNFSQAAQEFARRQSPPNP